MVDLDKNELHATAQATQFPRQHRRKLMALLYLAAPHHQTRGVPTGPPAYAYEAFPNNMFVSENPSVFTPNISSTRLSKLASSSSTNFGARNSTRVSPIFNAFLQAMPTSAAGSEAPSTMSNTKTPSHTEGSDQVSPMTAAFPHRPTTPRSKTDSGAMLQHSLRQKRSGHFDLRSRQSPSLPNIRRKASGSPFVRHGASMSQVSEGKSMYASSMYSQSTLAASTIMPGTPYQSVRSTATTQWQEGHCLQWYESEDQPVCSVCNEKGEEGIFKCIDCPVQAHARCIPQICLPCQAAFCPEQVRAAFARFYASLFYNYRRFVTPADAIQSRLGLLQKFEVDAWIRTLPPDHAEYMEMLKDTQSFDEFINERETTRLSLSDSVTLFDAIMAAKKTRTKGVRSTIAVSLSGRNPFAGRSQAGGIPAEYLSDTSTHVWRVVPTPHSSEKADLGNAAKGREYRKIISRTPGKLEDDLFDAPPPVMKLKKVPTTAINGRVRNKSVAVGPNGTGF